MDFPTVLAEISELCVEHLGGHVGPQLAALAYTGFALRAADDARPPAGRARAGGTALLEPGTPWPEHHGIPLSLLMVVDTEELSPWLGDHLPAGAGLLNFFYLNPKPGDAVSLKRYLALDLIGDPACCRVIPADAARAVEVPAPHSATVYPPVALHAEPDALLPDFTDPQLDVIDLGDDLAADHPLPGLYVSDEFLTPWLRYVRQRRSGRQIFGWLSTLRADQPTPDGKRHLLELPTTDDHWSWSEGGSLHFLIPAAALRDGDFTQACTGQEGW